MLRNVLFICIAKEGIHLKKNATFLLRALTAGLIFCGVCSARIYSGYIDDWCFSLYGERLKPAENAEAGKR